MFSTIFDIAANAMSANRLRINTIASNIANAETTQTKEGGPYKRRDVVFAATDVDTKEAFSNTLDQATLKGVKVAAVTKDDKPPRMIYDPGHPDADPLTGMVAMPNVNPVTEMVNLLTASAAYKAASEVVNVTKDLAAAVRRLGERV
ncbi:MAG: flagellar basal body rod protein FlgC [Deltaproteobacteria bacterium]|nr:flagellar basal body rod protein FlgC [Deltaproteobacteria bacterium]